MKKHFLLLVMALMSLTGWAQTATLGDVAIGDYTYGRYSLPDDAVVKDSEGALLTKGTHYTISDGAFSDEACETAVADLANLKADGTTKYYRLITGIGAYAGQKKAVWFKVAKADATIHLADALTKYYRANDPAIPTADGAYTITYKQAVSENEAEDEVVNITDQFEGTLAYSYVGENAGEYALTFSGITPKATGIGANFNLVTTDKITITPLNISETATITAWQGDVEYTGNPFVGVYTVKDKAEGGIVLEAGTPAVEATLTTPAVAATGDYYVDEKTAVLWEDHKVAENRPTIHFQGNYAGSITVAEGKGFKITPAPLAVTVEDFKVDYDNNDHARLVAPADVEAELPEAAEAVKFVYSGFLGADIQPGAKATLIAAFTDPTKVVYDGEAINAGEYALTISGGSAGEGNYEFKNYLPGKLIINKKKYELTSKDATKVLGEKDPEFELNAAPVLVSGNDKLSGITFDREKGETAGKYTITPVVTAAKVTRTEGAKTTDVSANYEFVAAEAQGKLTITAAGIVISIKDASKKYGVADPTKFDYVVTGLQEGDVLGEVTVTRDKAGTAAGEAVGAYLLTAVAPANPDKDKYASVTVVPAIFTIAQAELEITMPTKSVAKTTGTAADLKKDGITAEGINNTDKIADLIEDLAFYEGVNVTNDRTFDPGYKATLTEAAQVNYKITKVNGVAIGGETLNTATVATGKLIVGAGSGAAITLKRAAKEDVAKTAIDEANDAAALIAKYAGEVVSVSIGEYALLPEKWYPIVLPFETSVGEISNRFGYAVVNVLNKANTDPTKISFKLQMGTIPANTPFVVKVYANTEDHKIDMNTATKDEAAFSGKIVAPSDYEAVTSEDAVDASGVKFIGTYLGKTDGFRSNQYYFSASADYNQYYQGNATNKTYLRPLGAYLQVPDGSAARTIEFEEADGTVTAIKVVKAENGVANAEGWYTIGGVKLQGAPTQKGIYIQNGKKVVVK